ncbi:MAG TPA: M1 family metallopeptidase [Rhodothermales bacterium]|nr:M1 family metallopeptidase [Rhodothermales bacterium]
MDAETFRVKDVRGLEGKILKFEYAPSPQHRQGGLQIELGKSLKYDEKAAVTIRYEAIGVKPDPTKFGMSQGYDLGLTFKKATETRKILANTLSFPEGARHWFPCNDTPNDKASQELIAHIPASMKALSNGKLMSNTVKNGIRSVHWKQEKPHSTYLSVLVAGDYAVLHEQYKKVSLGYWVYPKDVSNAMRSFNQTPQIMAFMEELFGTAFPWDKNDQITIPGIGGGAESTGATVLGESTIHDERADPDFPSHWLVAHEAAHQWFGDLITARDWSETWLNESFATFAENDYIRHSLGEKEGQKYRMDKWNGYLQETSTKYTRPIRYRGFTMPNEHFDRHTYHKGSIVLHYLRAVMGKDAFTRSLALFLKRHAFQPATTEDLKDAIKDATGQNLDWFFNQWIDRAGHPILGVQYNWSETDKQLNLRIQQKQTVSDAVPLFELKTHIEVALPHTTQSFPIQISSADSTYILKLHEPSTGRPRIQFDPQMTLPAELQYDVSETEWRNILQTGSVRDQLLAIAYFGKELENYASLLQETAQKDPFWAIRQAATQVFVHAPDPNRFADFFRAQLNDVHSRVRVSAVRGLAATKQTIHAPILRTLFANDKSYLVQAEALRALGACGNPSDLPLLEAARTIASPRNVLQTAADEALRILRQN